MYTPPSASLSSMYNFSVSLMYLFPAGVDELRTHQRADHIRPTKATSEEKINKEGSILNILFQPNLSSC